MTWIFGLAGLYLGLLAAKTASALSVVWRAPRSEATSGVGVCVAQAILGGDPGLAEVLAWNLRELPQAHFLWLVDDDDPVGREVCRELVERHPDRHIELIELPEPPPGHNPKLHKLALARPAMREGVLLVLDDDTRMPAPTLAGLVAALGTQPAPPGPVVVATSLPGYLDDGRWPSRGLAQFVDNNAALTYLPLLPFLPPLTLNGMAYALRVEDLDRLGGFTPLLGYLTDDLAMAERVLAVGGRITQLPDPHWVETTVRDGRHYLQLMHRWHLFALLLLRKQPAGVAALIGLVDGLPPALLLAVAVSALASPSPTSLGTLVIVLLVRGLTLTLLQRAVYGRPLHAPLTSVASELAQPLHLLHAVLSRRIVWRKRRYRVTSDQEFQEIP
jgi:ceramide glucosyltransferase